jgi:phospholipase C
MNRARILGLTLSAAVIGLALAGAGGAKASEPQQAPKPKTPIEHFVVLMQENHSFDNYFGTYPGADGIPPGTCMPLNPADPTQGCVEPFHIGDNEVESTDLDHSAETHRLQYNQGRLDGFVYALGLRNQDGRLAVGYYDDRDIPLYWNIADQYVLFDRFFSSAAAGSLINHMFWVAGAPGDGGDRFLPEGMGDLPTIFDRLQQRGISWKFYVQNYDPGLNYRTVHNFPGNRASQVVWVPILNFDRFIDDPELSSHIVDLNEFFEDVRNGTLPAVVPSGASEHPPGSLLSGQRLVRSLINELMRSDLWYSSAFMWAYDDWGGWYDHVPPPQVDDYGYGFRVPALLVSAYARRGYVDSTELDYTSILKFIEENWGLEPLAERDAKANSMANAFDFSQTPSEPALVSPERGVEQLVKPRRAVIYGAYGGALAVPALVIAWAALGPVLFRRRATGSSAHLAQDGDEW